MATVDGFTAEAMGDFVDNSITNGSVDVDGHLILTTHGGDTVDAGEVVGPAGPTGPPGPPGSSAGAPTGTVAMFAALIPPTGWVVCDGSTLSRTTFSTLYSVIGNTFGAGDGATTFNLPDFRTRIPRQDNANLGLKGGLAPAAHAHAIDGGASDAVAHVSFVTGPAPNVHMERISVPSYSSNFDVTANGLAVASGTSGHTNGAKVSGTTADNQVPIAPTDLLPPFLNVSFIIKT